MGSIGFGKCIMSCIYHHSIIYSGFTALKIPCYTYPFLLPKFLATIVIFPVSIVLPFPECYNVGGIQTQCAFFSFIFFFCDLMSHFFLSLINTPLSRYMTICLSIHLLKDFLVSFRFWQVWKIKTAINIWVQIFV